MPKMKTRRSAAKRFKITPTGKVMFLPAGLRHNLENKTGKQKRHNADPEAMAPEHAKVAKRLLGKR
jgi:large subunit ribosomal protein L35